MILLTRGRLGEGGLSEASVAVCPACGASSVDVVAWALKPCSSGPSKEDRLRLRRVGRGPVDMLGGWVSWEVVVARTDGFARAAPSELLDILGVFRAEIWVLVEWWGLVAVDGWSGVTGVCGTEAFSSARTKWRSHRLQLRLVLGE